MNITVTLPFPPSLNMAFPTNKQGRRYKSKRYEAFKSDATVVLMAKRFPVLKGRLKVNLKLFRPKKSGDIDNYGKCVFDVLKGYCFVDDSQIVELHIFRFDDKEFPRVEVEIKEV